MSRYTEGSMMGSGIYSGYTTTSLDCPECNHVWDQDVYTNDWGNIREDVSCPACSTTFWLDRDKGEY